MIDRNFIMNMVQESSDINEYLMSLYNIPVQMGANTIVEIGAGRSTFALVAAANKLEGLPEPHVYSIDIGGWETLDRVHEGKSMMEQEKRFTMIQGNSLNVLWPSNNSNIIDFLFLDSEHTYDLTIGEMQRWFPFVRRGGIIAMHDTAHESGQQMECRKALEDYLENREGEYAVVHLLDSKIIGMSILVKL